MSLQESQKRKVKICIVAILLLIVIASLIFVKSKNTTKIVTDKELLKAMTYAEVIDGEGSIENTENNVSFDVFFMRDLDGDGIEEKLRGTCKQIGKEDTLYMQLDVFDGELKDAQIFVNENEIVVDCKFKPTLIPQLLELGILKKQVGICVKDAMIYPIYTVDLTKIIQKQYCMQELVAA